MRNNSFKRTCTDKSLRTLESEKEPIKVRIWKKKKDILQQNTSPSFFRILQLMAVNESLCEANVLRHIVPSLITLFLDRSRSLKK